MKSSQIISHILNQPLFQKVKAADEALKVLALLGPTRFKLIKYVYVKENKIFAATEHAAYLQELKHDSNISLIKSLLKSYNEKNESSTLKEVNDVKFFQTKRPFELLKFYLPPIFPVAPKATSGFVNEAKDRAVFDAFEKLRETLKMCENLKRTAEKRARNG